MTQMELERADRAIQALNDIAKGLQAISSSLDEVSNSITYKETDPQKIADAISDAMRQWLLSRDSE